MSEVVVVAVITAKEGMRDRIEELARDVAIPGTHAEPGCIAYALHRDTRNPDRLAFVERWTSAAALGEHMQTAHLKEFVAAVADLTAAPSEVFVLEPCGYGAEKGVLGA